MAEFRARSGREASERRMAGKGATLPNAGSEDERPLWGKMEPVRSVANGSDADLSR